MITRAAEAARERVSRLPRGALVGLVAGALLLGGLLVSGEESHQLTGTFTLYDPDSFDWVPNGSDCSGGSDSWGYADIHAGTEVVVTNGRRQALATGELGDGVVRGSTCVFSLVLPEVADAARYRVSVSHRGTTRYTKGDLEANGWSVDLSLGY